MTTSTAFGNTTTRFFYELTPEKILDSVEALGLECTGRVLQLNSMENRVFEVEVEIEDQSTITSPSDKFRVVKFYRPGRWSKEQILEEHSFLLDLEENEVPVIAPLKFENQTVHEIKDLGIYYTLFPKMGGRNPDEFSKEQLTQLGRLLGRMHNVGKLRVAKHRISLTPETYGLQNLNFILSSGTIPKNFADRYKIIVEEICTISNRLFEGVTLQRIHGDCHMGNLLWGSKGPFWVDFDDMVNGPAVQDMWLIVPGRDAESKDKLDALIAGYDQMSDFNKSTLSLIEPLRALRFIHFAAWIAKRWEDPSFKKVFTDFGSERYWQEQVVDLSGQLELIRDGSQY
ncbi:MAG: serine/threonine protein kinase [bacterium]|nr:serine/threonine protein kinase [bacterium]